MEVLKVENNQESYNYLKRAEEILVKRLSELDIPQQKKHHLLSITMNNFGCYYKKQKFYFDLHRINSPQVALYYLKNALEQEIKSNLDSVSIAGSMLNICAILSKLKRHYDAILYARRAIKIMEQKVKKLQDQELQQDIQELKEEQEEDLETSGRRVQSRERINDEKQQKANIYTTITIAYYNLAVEHEFLLELEDAIFFYKKALCSAYNFLGSQAPIIKNINKSIKEVELKLQQQNELHLQRQKQRDLGRTQQYLMNQSLDKFPRIFKNKRNEYIKVYPQIYMKKKALSPKANFKQKKGFTHKLQNSLERSRSKDEDRQIQKKVVSQRRILKKPMLFNKEDRELEQIKSLFLRQASPPQSFKLKSQTVLNKLSERYKNVWEESQREAKISKIDKTISQQKVYEENQPQQIKSQKKRVVRSSYSMRKPQNQNAIQLSNPLDSIPQTEEQEDFKIPQQLNKTSVFQSIEEKQKNYSELGKENQLTKRMSQELRVVKRMTQEPSQDEINQSQNLIYVPRKQEGSNKMIKLSELSRKQSAMYSDQITDAVSRRALQNTDRKIREENGECDSNVLTPPTVMAYQHANIRQV